MAGSGGVDPAGTVNFDIGDTTCDAVAVVAHPSPGVDAGTATWAITVNPGQSVSVSAGYTSGDGAYTNASSPPVTYTDQATPTGAVTPSGTGPSGSVTFTATVTGSGYTSANAVYTDANSTPVTFTGQGTPTVSISGPPRETRVRWPSPSQSPTATGSGRSVA